MSKRTHAAASGGGGAGGKRPANGGIVGAQPGVLRILITDSRAFGSPTYFAEMAAPDCRDHARAHARWLSLCKDRKLLFVPGVTDPIYDSDSLLLWDGTIRQTEAQREAPSEGVVFKDGWLEDGGDGKRAVESTDAWAFIEHCLAGQRPIAAGCYRPQSHQMHLILVRAVCECCACARAHLLLLWSEGFVCVCVCVRCYVCI